MYSGEAPGTYVLEFGVSNANDNEFDSGLAFAGVEAGGVPVGTPEPSTWVMMGIGFLGLGGAVMRRRRRRPAFEARLTFSAGSIGAPGHRESVARAQSF